MGDVEYVCSACGARASTSDRVGICPSCKNGLLTPVPAGSARPKVSLPGPAAPQRVSSSGTGGAGLAKAVIAVLVFGGIIAGVKYGPIGLDRLRHPSKLIKGDFVSQHLGVTMTLEPGWRHLGKDDKTEHYEPEQLAGGMPLSREQRAQVGGANLHVSLFFRGGTSSDPKDGLMVGMLEFQSPLLRQAITADLLAAAKAGAENAQQETSRWNVELGNCGLEDNQGYTFARCSGRVGNQKESAVVFYMYVTGRGIGLVVLTSHDPPDKAAERARTVLLSMH